jgi:membrane protein DedA with SNARE-associated domain
MGSAGLVVFLTACVHEDVAILAAAYFVVEHDVPAPFAGVVAFAGMMANNLALYFLGASTRCHPWVQRWLANDRAVRIREKLHRHLVPTLALSRLGQGMLTPTLLGCGWLHVPLKRVLTVVSVSAAIYLSVLLTVVVMLGQAVMRELGNWAWVAPAVVTAWAAVFFLRRRLARS